MEQLKREHVKLKEENNHDLTKLLQDLAMLKQLIETLTAEKAEELESKAREIDELKAVLQQLKQNHAHVGDLTKKHQAELEELQFEMLRTVEKERANSNKLVKEVQAEFGEEKAKLCRDFEAAIKQREENYKEASVLAEIQMKEKCSEIEADWQLKLAAIAEYTVIPCEVEKNQAIYELAEHKKAMEELQMENSKVSADCSNFRGKCNELEEQLTSLTDEFVKLQEKFAQEKESYLQSMEQANKDKHLYDVLMQTFEALEIDNKDLRETVAEQEAVIGPFRDTLMVYEVEYKALVDQKRSVEHDSKEMGMKYAQMLGHQNLKQKIKHLVDLKQKNYDLAETNKELEAKVRSQARTIEKLKKE